MMRQYRRARRSRRIRVRAQWRIAITAKGNDLIVRRCFAPCERCGEKLADQNGANPWTTHLHALLKVFVHSKFRTLKSRTNANRANGCTDGIAGNSPNAAEGIAVAQGARVARVDFMTMAKAISGGLAHDLPEDLRKALRSDPKALAIWETLTPLARNEWICWMISVKAPETRREHVERICSELHEGMRRPCCWMGCVHRTDKPLSPSQKYLLGRRSKK